MLRDGSGRVTGSYGISQVPETYVLDKQGREDSDPGHRERLRPEL
jgi:hypothetical protein